MATTYLSRTFTAGNTDKWTFSAWVKRCPDGVAQFIFSGWADASNYTGMYFDTDESLHFYNRSGGGAAGQQVTSALFRDPGSWYHLVFVWDSGNATSGDRMRIYVNGEEVTAFAVDNAPTQNLDSSANVSGNTCYVGQRGNGLYWNGSMSHVHFCDGQTYAASDFGETDSTSGIWVAKTSPSVTYGTNGYFLKFASGASGTDSSGEGNNMTVSGTLTNLKDTPHNNYATGNSVYNMVGGTFSNGNNTIVGAGNWFTLASTLGVDSGKWYAEFKLSAGTNSHVGVCGDYKINQQTAGDYGFGSNYGNPSIGLHQSGNIYVNTSGPGSSFSGGQSTGDIIGLALDMDNRKAYWHKNGEWATGSGAWDSTTFDAAVGAQTLDVGDYALADIWFMGCSGNSSTQQANWGNGYFGTTAVSSAGTSSSGDTSVWEYDCPTGFYGLNTKNLGSYS